MLVEDLKTAWLVSFKARHLSMVLDKRIWDGHFVGDKREPDWFSVPG